ncbi:hypothetical protein MMC19_002015 [Ptychographa xylographoides]|nr:hypothetical protein [Ptychographa xylographoides]
MQIPGAMVLHGNIIHQETDAGTIVEKVETGTLTAEVEGTGDGHDLPVTVIRDLLVGTLRWIHILRAATTEHANGKTDTRGESQGMKERGIEETGETEGCSDVMLGAMTMIDELQETEICGRSDRDEFALQQGARKKSMSPPPKKKEPTPDLTDIVPITDRKRRLTQWDIKPPGYENVTAEQAKLSGMFPLPGAPRQQPMDPSRLQAFMNQPGGSASNAALKPSNARQSKRLFVHNIPSSSTDESIINFFNLQLNGLNVIEGIDPCISCQISKDRSFALIEFKTPMEATMGLALDGITMEDNDNMDTTNGAANGGAHGISVRRPKDYIVPSITDDEEHMEGVVNSTVPDTQNKISVTNIPIYLTDEQVTELLVTFGILKAFVLVKDRSTEESRGIAFCEYLNPANTDIATEGLNGMEIGEKHLKVQRASIGVTQASGLEMGVNAMSMLAGTTSNDLEEGRVLQLLNMVTPEELIDNEDYEEIVEDVKEECEKYGPVLEIKVPRPSGGSRQSAGVGKIFIKYDNADSARKALQALAGRKFADRTVVTTYFSEENFEVNAW